jgi:hypothetical protein
MFTHNETNAYNDKTFHNFELHVLAVTFHDPSEGTYGKDWYKLIITPKYQRHLGDYGPKFYNDDDEYCGDVFDSITYPPGLDAARAYTEYYDLEFDDSYCVPLSESDCMYVSFTLERWRTFRKETQTKATFIGGESYNTAFWTVQFWFSNYGCYVSFQLRVNRI